MKIMADGSYTGVDNLDAMAEARNYNDFLVREILRGCEGASTVVDFGAGCGTFARMLRERGVEVTCVEPDEGMRRALESQGFECRADVEEIAEGSVDYMFSLNVLEHIEDDLGMLRVLRRRLRPGGRLYLYVPAFPVLYTSMDRKVGHFRRYKARSLSGKLRSAGFQVTEARYADSLGFFVTLLYRLIGNRRGDLNPGALKFYDRMIFPLSRMLDKFVGRVLGKNAAVWAVRVEEAEGQIDMPAYQQAAA
jgi:SAM-dependent methyltransferase